MQFVLDMTISNYWSGNIALCIYVASRCMLSDGFCITSVCLAFNCHLQPIHYLGSTMIGSIISNAQARRLFFSPTINQQLYMEATQSRVLRRPTQIFRLSIVFNCRLRPKIVAFFAGQLGGRIRSVSQAGDQQVEGTLPLSTLKLQPKKCKMQICIISRQQAHFHCQP